MDELLHRKSSVCQRIFSRFVSLSQVLLCMQGERKKRNKCCVMDTRYADPTLVDPELPSSWKARQVAVQLSDSDDISSIPAGNGLSWPTADCSMSDGCQRYMSQFKEGIASLNPSLLLSLSLHVVFSLSHTHQNA